VLAYVTLTPKYSAYSVKYCYIVRTIENVFLSQEYASHRMEDYQNQKKLMRTHYDGQKRVHDE
jgi:hypothetical protein